MKKLLTSTVAKIVSLFLIGIFLLSIALGVVGVVFLAGEEVYFDGGVKFRADVLRRVTDYVTSDIIAYTDAVLEQDQGALVNYNYEERFNKQNSNVFFRVETQEGKVLLANEADDTHRAEYIDECTFYIRGELKSDTQAFDSAEAANTFAESYDSRSDCWVVSSIIDFDQDSYVVTVRYREIEIVEAVIYTYVRTELVADDVVRLAMNVVDALISMRFSLIFWVCFLSALWLVLLIFLLCAAGHRRGEEGICLRWIDRIPFDLFLLLLIAFVGIVVGICDYDWNILSISILIAVMIVSLLVTLFTFVVRVKAGKWWQNTLVYRIGKLFVRFLHFAGRVLGKIPLYWKSALIFLGICFTELFFLSCGYYVFWVWWFFEKFLLLPAVVALVLMLRRLQKSGEELASGNIGYKTELRFLFGDFRRHGENLNGIGQGLERALGEQMKSERMRTELITNVSHDIKTPLTSIINYVDLLKKEGPESEHAAEYLEVIDRQSARLRKLTEDLIEASKASTGNIAVNSERTDVNVLLAQANGEYESRLAERNITTVLTPSDRNPMILADGRLLWRVFDNLFGNIGKYAQEGTRVYLSSEVTESGEVRITFRNISHAPLNISGDELMERFVRGDESRNTEGSGLGLSIARSLTELQEGRLAIEIDGDLFKVILTFPPYKE